MLAKDIQEKIGRIKREAEERAAQRLAEKLNLKYINLATAPIGIEAVSLIKEDDARKAQILGVEKKYRRVAVAAVNPHEEKTKEVVQDLEKRGFTVSVFVISPASLAYGLDFYKFVAEETEKITGKITIHKKTEKESSLNTISGLRDALNKIEFIGSQTSLVLETILKGAMENRASDIHLEPTDKNVNLRLRIDGNLNDAFVLEKNFYPYLISRLKLLANLKLNVTDEPQDGRFTINFPSKKDLEVRLAVAPAQFGEVAVMRLLDPDTINLNLTDLGLREDDLKIIEEELKRPNGMILNTGPTGSGKTTTLYAFLKYKKSPSLKIITIEDPIEYRLEGIEQTQTDEDAGYTFANGLRSLMRQDPDIILVGEIRDKETAEIGVQAALTGHLVFSTVHANSASGAIPRLLDLNVKPTSIGPALNLVIGQRLVRRLCLKCRAPQETDESFKNKIEKFLQALPERVNKKNYQRLALFQAKGCVECNQSGYKGRVAIYELLKFIPEMEQLILSQQGEYVFEQFALKHAMTTLQQDGILKAISGLTTIEEVESITGPIKWQ